MNPSHTTAVKKVGFLHPGQMGVTIAAAVAEAGHTVSWASHGRSTDTVNRAEQYRLEDSGTLEALCSDCQYIFSVCPPNQAGAVAQQVANTGFNGKYIDCNAVSPTTSAQVKTSVTQHGASYVDGGIIGPPAVKAGTTRLYLSGECASDVASLFMNSTVDARTLGLDTTAASALKMAYAGWTKGSAALLITQFALARALNVESALLEEWELSQPGLIAKLDAACSSNVPKAWRFTGEMQEIAIALEAAGLPGSWFDGAADVYGRLSQLKNRTDAGREDVIDILLT